MVFRKNKIKKTLSEMEISEGGVVTRIWGDYTTLRHLRELGIVEDTMVRRVLDKKDPAAPVKLSFKIGDRSVDLDDLSAGSVEVSVPRVYGYESPEPGMERWRLEYLRRSPR